MKRQRPKKRVRTSPWILGGILLGATVDHFVEVPLKRQLEFNMSPDSLSPQNDIHIVFSTGCSPSQNWQSYVFFFHAMQVKQPGEITRIVSGCTEVQRQDLARRHHEEVFEKMSNKFHIHFTPGYDNLAKDGNPYKYFNKPFGLRHWMQNALGFPENRHKYEKTIIASLDPDMMLVKPLLNNFSALPKETWNTLQPENKTELFVKHGHPIAQEYSYESSWKLGLGDNVKMILGDDSPVYNVSKSDARLYYPAGPPYMLTAWDLYDIVLTWTAIAPTVHKNYPRILGEMFAYSIAAAHHELKHQLNMGLMVSDARVKREGWHFLRDVPPAQICGPQDPDRLPQVLHYCQDYSVGNYHVSKYDIPDSFISCEAPLLMEPPRDAAVRFNFSRTYFGKIRTETSREQSLRHAFMTCAVISYLNDAATFYKQNQCGLNGNFNKTWSNFPVTSN